MAINIIDIKNQPLGILLTNFLICQHCNYVDRDMNRMRVGHPCQKCGNASPAGRSYFNHSVSSLIDLMQEFFHKDELIESTISKTRKKRLQNSRLAVVVYFVTLREVLLTKLLKELMIAQKIPIKIEKRLFDDNLTHKQKLDKLFPSLVGKSWNTAVKQVNERVELDYLQVNKFLVDAVRVRNKFLHEGQKFAIKKDLAENCIRNIGPLLSLHVSLHNDFVFPLYQEK